jgi:hypothetical protein
MSRVRQQGIFSVVDVSQPLQIRTWCEESGTFLSPEERTDDAGSALNDQVDSNPMFDVPCAVTPEDFDVAPDASANLGWELCAVQAHASPDEIVDDVLLRNVHFLEFSEDGQAVFLMPAFRVTQNDTFCVITQLVP